MDQLSTSYSLFCGKPSTNQTIRESYDSSKWTFVRNIENQCFVNYQYLWPNLVIIPALLLALLYIKTWGRIDRSPNYRKKYQLTFPLHNLRCSIFIALTIVQLFNFGEAIVTDMEIQSHLPTQPQLYLPPFLAILATVVVAIYYQKMEVWNKPSGLGFLLLYWLWSLVIEIVKLINLSYDDEFDIGIMRVLISIILATIYVVLIGIECHVYAYKSRFGRDNLLKDLPDDLSDDNFRYLFEYSSLYSKLLLHWMKPLFDLGKRRALELTDLGSIPNRFQSQKLYVRMEAEIQKQRQQSIDEGIKSPTVRLYPILTKIYGWDIFVVIIIRIIASLSFVASSFFIKGILNYVTEIQRDEATMITHNVTIDEFFKNGFVLALCLGVVSFALALMFQYSFISLIHSAVPARSSLQAVVYQKAMRLSTGALLDSDMNKGKISNLISVDPNQLLTGIIWFPMIFGTPSLVIFNTISLFQLLGPSSILALLMIVLTFPVQGLILNAYSKIRTKSMFRADDRLKVTNETLQGIKVVKLFGWEDIFFGKIKTARDEQVTELRKGIVVGGLLIPAGSLGGSLATVVALGLYSAFNGGRPLTPDLAFPASVLLMGIVSQVVTLPPALRLCVNANVSIRRLEKYLSAPEIENKVVGRDSMASITKIRSQRGDIGATETDPLLEPQYGTFSYSKLDEDPLYAEPALEEETEAINLPQDVAIRIRDGAFTWNPDNGEATLSEINVDIPTGKFTMIIGEVGSGKSSLLSAMLGEMQTVRGEVIWNKNKSNAALADQRAWLQNATLKDNIIFDNYEGEGRYMDVVRCCALEPDIAILPAGDETEIGEKGINLSGGQKQRINVGRALYSKADIVFLDDPLSALDSHVGSQLFAEGFQGWLRGENRTIILVTHQLKHIEEADYLIVMKEGAVHIQGSPGQIERDHPDLWQTWQEMVRTEVKEEEEEQKVAERKAQEERIRLFRQISEHEKEEKYRRMSSISSIEGGEDIHVAGIGELNIAALDEEDNPKKGQLIQMEERQTGSIEWRVYLYFAKMAGLLTVLILSVAIAIQQAFSVSTQFWLNDWSQSGLDSIEQDKIESYDTKFYVLVYLLLSAGNVASGFFSSILVYWAALMAGKRLHNSSLSSVIRSPLRFFDTTPSGRIMNRFSSDLDKVDQELGLQMSVFIMTALFVFGGIIINAVVAQFFSVALLPFFAFFIYVTKYYLMSTREMKRLESISLSPVYNHFAETLTGLPTIRAYAYQTQFSKESFRRIDQSAVVSLFRSLAGVWLAVQLALISNTLFIFLGIILIGMAKTGSILTGAVGLGLSSIVNSCSQFATIVNNAAEIEMSMNAVERLSYYDNLPSEEYDGIVDPPSIWPDRGEIVLDRIWVRYDEELDPVLKNVSLTFKPEEKIGICGRTGSGKSSLTLSLFRIVDIFSGHVYIDGMNVKHIPLTQLRRKIAIVPQDPILFTGSIRFNLDPFDELTDEKLWEALEIAQLKNVVNKLQGGLDGTVSEGGENFSVGQRQLFCLARAFLRDTRILIMDEATASIDMETDAILQKIVASAFDKRTVLTIAHRTATILDADRVVVLDDGRVAENDSPGRLLQRNSIFASLVQQNK